MSKGEQLALAFPRLYRDPHATFAEGPSNRFARLALNEWRHWPSGALALVGPEGCGKSHLAAIWAKDESAAVIAPAAWAAAPYQVISDHQGRPVVLEDADSPHAQPSDALYALLNAARSGDLAAALITARTPPSSWLINHNSVSADTASRLQSLPVLEVSDPDDQELGQILRKLFADRGVNISDAVVAYLVKRMERSHAAAAAVVDALDRRALAEQAKITRRLAARVLNNELE